MPDLIPEEALSSMNPPSCAAPNVGPQNNGHSAQPTFIGHNPLRERKAVFADEGSAADTILPGTYHQENRDAASVTGTSQKSSTYSPSRNALMKAGWFGVLDSTVVSINEIPSVVLSDGEGSVTEGDSEVKPKKGVGVTKLTLSHCPSNQLLSGVPSQPVSPLESPLRLIHHPRPTWNIDSSTQTGSSLKLNGRSSSAKIVANTCKSCSIM